MRKLHFFYTLYYSLSEEMTFALFSSTLDLGWIAGSIQLKWTSFFSEQRALLIPAAAQGD